MKMPSWLPEVICVANLIGIYLTAEQVKTIHVVAFAGWFSAMLLARYLRKESVI